MIDFATLMMSDIRLLIYWIPIYHKAYFESKDSKIKTLTLFRTAS
jgi:hypothetical protein